MAYALRWGVTHLGLFHYWALAHPVEGIILFQVQGVQEETAHPRGRVGEESRVVALVF